MSSHSLNLAARRRADDAPQMDGKPGTAISRPATRFARATAPTETNGTVMTAADRTDDWPHRTGGPEEGDVARGFDLPEPEVDRDRIRAEQIREVARFTPTIMSAMAFSSLVFLPVAWQTANRMLLLAWLAMAWLLIARQMLAWHRNRDNNRQRVPVRVERRALFWGALQGTVWAMLPALFFVGSPAAQQLVILGALIALIYGGAMALIRLPATALVFVGPMLVSLITALLVEGGTAYQLLALLCAGTGLIGFLGVRHHARLAYRHLVMAQEIEHQREVIMLLLKDFEKGAGDWLWETDADCRLTSISQSFAKIVGIDPQRLIGRRLSDLQLDEDSPDWEHLKAALNRHRAIEGTVVPVTVQDERRWWSLTALPRFDEAGRFLGYRGVGSDATAGKNAEIALKEAKEAAERANAAKSKFLAVLSHELRSPLNAVIGFSEIIAEQSFGPISVPKYADYAREIRDSSKHLLALIDDMLDIARIESGAVEVNEEEFGTDKMFDGVRRLMTPLAEKRGVQLDIEEPVTARLQADPRLVRQILINLMTNAIKFTPAGGTVTLGTAVRADGSVTLWVRDSGIGIAPEDRERVFQPFTQIDETLSRSAEGVGLGLAIAVHLARAHGGDLTLDSMLGKGTTVYFTLPRWRVVKALAPNLHAVA